MDSVHRGLLIHPRPDLSSPMVEAVEWRLRAHDGLRLWGLRGQSPFHSLPRGARFREVPAFELPALSLDVVCEGCVDYVFQVPAGRRLEDRVLDLLRVIRVAAEIDGLEPEGVRLKTAEPCPPDEFLIAERLLEEGICSLP